MRKNERGRENEEEWEREKKFQLPKNQTGRTEKFVFLLEQEFFEDNKSRKMTKTRLLSLFFLFYYYKERREKEGEKGTK